ncbi:hypothetical protein [Burkholderia seminalis]|uniref:Uncharacterized protein n=1 Tax=Burkholderia seminalis TaxID=488731 RepID=A0A8A8D4L7_9BURK|nr:hypothetical protein [Burkholderia seminalis]QTO19591.1 hypothetical protein DT99_004935 [Burkholderia seminalis]
MMKKRNKNTTALCADAAQRYGAMGNISRLGLPGVKVHAGWDRGTRPSVSSSRNVDTNVRTGSTMNLGSVA